MHLIEGSESWIIEDLDNERSYILSDGKQVMTAKWPTTAEQERPHFIAIATGEEAALRVWNHLRSMLISEAPQPAPVETPEPRKFGVGDKARVLAEHRSNYNKIITVEGYTPEGYVYSHGGLCSYDEDELEPQPHDAVMVVRKAD